MDYLYDGTFEGLLTCIYYHYKVQNATGIYELKSYQPSFVNNNRAVKTDVGFADTVYDAIVNKISKRAMKMIYYAYLSDDIYKENKILEFVKFGFKRKVDVCDIYSAPEVLPIRELNTKVSHESHNFLGLLRFSDVGGALYAKYNPDSNITVLLMDHFSDRYKNERFIIYDEKRNIAGVYADNRWEIVESDMNIDEFSKDEKLFRELWTEYFNTLAIEERKNINLQFQHVPARFRKNITEFHSEKR